MEVGVLGNVHQSQATTRVSKETETQRVIATLALKQNIGSRHVSRNHKVQPHGGLGSRAQLHANSPRILQVKLELCNMQLFE